MVDGLLNLDAFSEDTLIDLPEGAYETVAGFMAAELGRIPMVSDEVSVSDGVLTVTEMDGRRISRIRVVRNSQTD